MYKQACIVFICENYPVGRAGEIAAALNIGQDEDRGNFCIMREFGQNKNVPGVGKTARSTQLMVAKMQRCLKEHALMFSSDFATFGGKNPESVVQRIEEQLLRFRWNEEDKKYNAKGPGQTDDLAVVMHMAPYWSIVFNDDKRYAGTRQRINNIQLTVDHIR